ncbi:expressed protein [Phakopsora pachyrhizi]|uniref:Expressed protein n=1 Tax=Phakopsora pachyrhizi TaxID=170000 RepID=A0AAV0AQK4_PHAPC|nr:expressed protein [Phakopsora pachyrhizi]
MMAKILFQFVLVTICLLNFSLGTMEWAELSKVSDQAKEASTATIPIGTHALGNSDHFTAEFSSQSLNSKIESFKDELLLIHDEIKYFNFGDQTRLKKTFYRVKSFIEKVLKNTKEYKAEERASSENLLNMRLNEILVEVKNCILEFQMTPNEIWDSVASAKWAVMSGILRVLDPFIKHGFLSTQKTQLLFKDPEILRASAYVTSIELPLRTKYWLPSVEVLKNLSRDEFLWLSMLQEPEAEFFLRQLIGIYYTNESSKISQPKLLPIVNLFLGNSEISKDTFDTLFEVIDESEKFHDTPDYEYELISNFVNQALSYVQSYAPTQVRMIYSGSRFDILWKKKELLDIICQLIPISKNYENSLEIFKSRKSSRGTMGKDQLEDYDDEVKIANFKKVLKALNNELGIIKTGAENLSEETLNMYSAVDREDLIRAFNFKAKVKQLSNSVNLIPATWSKEILDWLQLPTQDNLLYSIKRRALFLAEEVETLANLKNQLRDK